MFGYYNSHYGANMMQQHGASSSPYQNGATVTASPQCRSRYEDSPTQAAMTVVNPSYNQRAMPQRGYSDQQQAMCRQPISYAIPIKSGSTAYTQRSQPAQPAQPAQSEPIKISSSSQSKQISVSNTNPAPIAKPHSTSPVAPKANVPNIALLQSIIAKDRPSAQPTVQTTPTIAPVSVPNICALKELLAKDVPPQKTEQKTTKPLLETAFTSIGSSTMTAAQLNTAEGERRVHVLSGCTIQSIGKRRHDIEIDGNCSPSSEVGSILYSGINPSTDGSNHPTPEESSPLNTESTPTFSTPPLLEEPEHICEEDFREVCSPWHQAPISPTRLSSIPLTNDQEMPTPVTCKILEREGNKYFRSAAVAMNGFRTSMEDSHALICKDYGFFGVFDGHAGPVCSAYCAKEIPAELERTGVPISDEQLQELVLKLDTKFRQAHARGGSTAAMVIATPIGSHKERQYSLKIAHVGDSRVLVGSKTGVLKFFTTDHKPSLPAEQKRIESVGGFVKNDRVDGRLAMSRALGDDEFKRGSPDLRKLKVTALPDVSTFVCGRDDFVVIACDGVFEEMTNQEVVNFVSAQLQHTKDLGKVVAKLVDEALRKGSGDNITAALVQFKNGTNFKTPLEFIPGPYCPRKTQNFRTAYSYTSEKAGITLEKALNLRFQQLTELIGESLISTIKMGNRQNPCLDDLVREVQEWAEENLFAFTDACRTISEFVRPKLNADQMSVLNRIIASWQRTDNYHQPKQTAATYTNADIYGKQQQYSYGNQQQQRYNQNNLYPGYGQQQSQQYQGFHPYQQYQGQSYGR